MHFEMTPSCREVLVALVAFVTVSSALITAAVYGLDARYELRISHAIVPVEKRIAAIEFQVADTRQDVKDLKGWWLNSQRPR